MGVLVTFAVLAVIGIIIAVIGKASGSEKATSVGAEIGSYFFLRGCLPLIIIAIIIVIFISALDASTHNR